MWILPDVPCAPAGRRPLRGCGGSDSIWLFAQGGNRRGREAVAKGNYGEKMERELSKLDPHVHSKFSGEPSEWFLRKIGCPESFTEPIEIYELAKKRGMQFVTVTDHNAIDGCLEIAHLPGVVLGCELATYFPDNGCKIDVITLGIDEAQHAETMRLRENVFELVAYLNDEGIFHVLAHPLYVMNGLLDIDRFEQCLLLFKNMEVLNGTRTKPQNLTIRRLLERLDRETIYRLAEKHGLEPVGEEPWRKNCTAGSDDHGGMLIATTCTAVPRVDAIEEFFDAVRRGESRVEGTIGTSHTLAHNIYRVAYNYIVNVLGAYKPSRGDSLHYMVMKILFDDESAKPSTLDVVIRKIKKKLGLSEPDTSPYRILTMIKEEAKELIRIKPEHKKLLFEPLPEDKDVVNLGVYSFLSDVGNRVVARLAGELLEAAGEVRLSNVLDIVPAIGTAHFFMLPYYSAYGATSASNRLIDEVNRVYLPEHMRLRSKRKVAMFTDTYDEVNGVAIVVKQMAEEARRAGAEMYIVKAGPEETSFEGNVKHFQSVAEIAVPEYPETKMRFPSLLDVLDWCEAEEFTSIHAATPGTMGLAALLTAKILHLPFVGTYHTELTDYVRVLTGDDSMATAASKFVQWFYERMELIFAPSIASRDNLAAHGVRADLVRFIPWGVDMELFNSAKRDPAIWDRYDGKGSSLKLLYAGRISKEKDLDMLADVFIDLCRTRDDLMLVLAGDGPYREELQELLKPYPAVFLGNLDHDELANVYASADMFVFPSTTDTFGNVILEAQASGLPVIVSDKGGPKENVDDGKTGLVTPGRDRRALKEAILSLLDDPELRSRIAAAARPSVEGKSSEASFASYWELHR